MRATESLDEADEHNTKKISLWALQPVRRYSVLKSVRKVAKMAKLLRKFYAKIHHSQEDCEKSFIAYACFHNVKVGMKVAVVAFVEVSICFLEIHTYYISW